MPTIEVLGKASGKIQYIDIPSQEYSMNLLTFLRLKGITIASSCSGEGICRKCFIQNGWLTCEMTVEEFLKRCPDGKIQVDYL